MNIGVELEAERADAEAFCADFSEWDWAYDDSVGVEIRSPILRWPEDRARFQDAVRAWRTHVQRLSHAAGFHVHCSWDGMEPRVFGQLYEGFLTSQPALLQLLRPLQIRQWACQELVGAELTHYAAWQADEEPADAEWELNRYRLLNVYWAWRDHGTIEWRGFNGTKNWRKATAYVDLAVACTEAWKAGITLPDDPEALLDALGTWGLSPQSDDLWRTRLATPQPQL